MFCNDYVMFENKNDAKVPFFTNIINPGISVYINTHIHICVYMNTHIHELTNAYTHIICTSIYNIYGWKNIEYNKNGNIQYNK